MSYPSATPQERLNLLKELERRGGSAALKANPGAFSDYIAIIKEYPIVEERVAELVSETSKKETITADEDISGLAIWAEDHELGEIRALAKNLGKSQIAAGELGTVANELQKISNRLKEDPKRILNDAVSALEIAEELGGSAAFARYTESPGASETTVGGENQRGTLVHVPAMMSLRPSVWHISLSVAARGLRADGTVTGTPAGAAMTVQGRLSHNNDLPGRQTNVAIRTEGNMLVARFTGPATATLHSVSSGDLRYDGQVRWRGN